MDSIELIKKLGAGLVIVILSIMMLITFSSQQYDDIISILSGQAKLGKFNGKDIPPDIYYWAKDYCQKNYERYGDIPEQFINNCATEQLKQMYTLSSLGNKMGIRTSRKSIETKLGETIKQLQTQQNQYLDPDDRLPVEELYRRELIQMPITTRQLISNAGMAADLLSKPLHVPSTVLEARQNAENIKMDFRIVRYSTTDLLQQLGKNISIPEDEIRAEFSRREKLKEGKNPATYESQKELVENELKTSRKQTELGNIKKELSEMKNPELEKISALTFSKIISLKNVTLENLKSVKADNGAVNLARSEILSNPVKGIYGPFQDGEFTVYAELMEISVQKTASKEKELADNEKNVSQRMGNKLYSFLLDNEARIGKFYLNPALTQGQ